MFNKIRMLFDFPNVSYKTHFKKQDTDYEIVGAIKDSIVVPPTNIPEARNRFNGIQYHQPNVHENSCSAHGPAGALTDLTGIKFTTQQIKDIWEQEVAKGNASPEWGGYSWKMVDAWRNYWNNLFKDNPDMQVCSIAVEMGSPLWFEFLNKGYSITSGYRWINGYDADWAYDIVVNRQWDNDKELESYGKFEDGGHCLRWSKSYNYAVKNNTIICIDNYSDSPTRTRYNSNIYGIDEKVIKELCEKGIWHEWGYVFMFKSDVEKANLVINKKLLERFECEIVYNAEKNKFAYIENGIPYELNGLPDLLIKFKQKDRKTSKAVGLTLNDFNSLGKLQKK